MEDEAITLSYILFESRLTEGERGRAITEDAIIMNLLLGELVFKVDGVPLGWQGYVPLVDAARVLFNAETSLSEDASVQYAELLDYQERLQFRLGGDRVEIYSEYTTKQVICDRRSLREKIVQFGSTIMRDCLRLYTHAPSSAVLRESIPAALMPS